jgi:hypothetical protein
MDHGALAVNTYDSMWPTLVPMVRYDPRYTNVVGNGC